MLKYILTYFNVVITLVFTISFALHAAPSTENALPGLFKAVDGVMFAILALWVYSFGLLITPLQLLYGFIKTCFAKDKKCIHKHHLVASLLTIVLYAIIFSLSSDYAVEVTIPETNRDDTKLGAFSE